MDIPQEIKDFISRAVELENFCLPHFYPKVNSFEDFQIGYKTNGNTGEKSQVRKKEILKKIGL